MSRRWLILLVCWLAFAISFIDRLAWGNLQLGVGRALGMGIGQLGLFVSAFYGGYVVANALSGFATDRIGPRTVLTAAAALLGLATAGFGAIGSPAAGLVLQALMGLAAGADYAACVKLIAGWFAPRLRGRAFGLWITASSLAVVLTNALVPLLAGALGWAGTYHVLGAATLGVAVICWAALRDPPEMPRTAPAVALRALLGNRDLLFTALAGFGGLWGTWGFAFWSNALMVRGQGIQPGQAAGIVALFGVGALAAKPLIGLASDWLGGARKGLIIAVFAGFVVMLLVFGRLHGQMQFRLAAPFLGVTAFAYSPLTAALVAELAGTAATGAASGLTNAVWQLGNVTAPAAVGAVFAATGSFTAAFVTLACGPLLGVAGMLGVRERRAATPIDNPARGKAGT